jgi:hypothetical protein
MERANIEELINNRLCEIRFDRELVVGQQVQIKIERNTYSIFFNIVDISISVETSIANKLEEN